MIKIKTKDKILDEALVQLNHNGLQEVSIRSISNALGLSSGNLTYHFKNIDVIIYELYLRLSHEMHQFIVSVEENEINLESLMVDTEKTFRLLWKYKFLLIDFIAINRRIPEMNVHFRTLMSVRKIQLRQIFDRLITAKILIPEPFPEIYNLLISQLIVFSNAWIQDAEIFFDGNEEKIIPHYILLFKGHFVPYLAIDVETFLE